MNDPYQDPHVDNRWLRLHYGDITGSPNLIRIVQENPPDEIDGLGEMRHVTVNP